MPNQAAWPKLGMPPGPIMKCRLAANSTAISISVSTDSAYGPATNGAATASSSAQPPAIRSASGAGRTTGSESGAGLASARARPSRPFGRNTSTTAITRKTSTSVTFGT